MDYKERPGADEPEEQGAQINQSSNGGDWGFSPEIFWNCCVQIIEFFVN